MVGQGMYALRRQSLDHIQTCYWWSLLQLSYVGIELKILSIWIWISTSLPFTSCIENTWIWPRPKNHCLSFYYGWLVKYDNSLTFMTRMSIGENAGSVQKTGPPAEQVPNHLTTAAFQFVWLDTISTRPITTVSLVRWASTSPTTRKPTVSIVQLGQALHQLEAQAEIKTRFLKLFFWTWKC